MQADELQFRTAPNKKGIGRFYWSLVPASDLTLYAQHDGGIWKFPVTGWNGPAPIYDLNRGQKFVDGARTESLAVDGDGRVLRNGQNVTAYRRDGSIEWTYPTSSGNPGQGVIVWPQRVTGISDLPAEAGGQVFAFNGNVGEWYLLTTDGVFIQHLFHDVRTLRSQGPEYLIGGEDFGGNFTKSA